MSFQQSNHASSYPKRAYDRALDEDDKDDEDDTFVEDPNDGTSDNDEDASDFESQPAAKRRKRAGTGNGSTRNSLAQTPNTASSGSPISSELGASATRAVTSDWHKCFDFFDKGNEKKARCKKCCIEFKVTNRKDHLMRHLAGTAKRRPCKRRALFEKDPELAQLLPALATEQQLSAQYRASSVNEGPRFQPLGQVYDPKRLEKMSAIWLVEAALPWTTVEDHTLREMFSFCRTDAQLSSAVYTAALAEELFNELRKSWSRTRETIPGQFAMYPDIWTMVGVRRAFLGCAISWMDNDFGFHSHFLLFKHLPDHHIGALTAEPLLSYLDRHKMLEKMSNITTDRESNSLTLVKAIREQQSSSGLTNSFTHAFCGAHGLQRVVFAGSAALGIKMASIARTKAPALSLNGAILLADEVQEGIAAEEDEVTVETAEEDRITVETAEGIAAEQIQEMAGRAGVMQDLEGEGSDGDADDGPLQDFSNEKFGFAYSGVEKCKAYVNFVMRNSRYRHYHDKKRLEMLAAGEHSSSSALPKLVGIRWGNLLTVLNACVDQYVVMRRVKDKFPNFVDIPSEEEIEAVRLYCSALGVIHQATLWFERNEPTLHMSVYILVGATEKLCEQWANLDNEKYFDIDYCIEAMLNKLGWYIKDALRSKAVTRAIVLNPCLRLNFIRKKFPDNAAAIEKDFRDEYDRRVKNLSPEIPSQQRVNRAVVGTRVWVEDNWSRVAHAPDASTNDKLNWYLSPKDSLPSLDPNDTDFCARFWKAQRIAGTADEALLSLARDTLGAMASTASTQRLFSGVGTICIPRKESLSVDSMEKLVTSHQWLKGGIRPLESSVECVEWDLTFRTLEAIQV
ncbi:hypothetical protein OIO90_004255 [Microbotryomycetes sp. JL221]|nr:hypothetical protein OIO90_004255 [Microbotryomycetes sp. JL221]